MLEARNLHKVYNDGKRDLQVLNGVGLKIEQAQFIAIVGPSGAGKSTLLHILGGLDSPSQGEVIFQGESIYRYNDLDLAKVRNEKIGFVFQFFHLLSEFTVLENVLMPALLGQRVNSVLKESALEFLTQVGLGERLTHFPNQLSGGEKQRVAIVRSLINKPEILFCDEPTGNLDSRSGEDVISLIKKINLKNRMSVVLVTHNIELAKSADKIYHLRDGMLVS